MIRRDAYVTDSTTTVAAIRDSSTRGLTIGHLRAFIQQSDLAGFTDDVKVRLSDELQPTSHWHTVEIRAEVKNSTTNDIVGTTPADVDGRDQ